MSDEDFYELVLRYQEKNLTPDDLDRLSRELDNNPERQAEFTAVCDTSRLLREVSAVSCPSKRDQGRTLRPFLSLALIERLGLAALVVLCLALIWALHNRAGSPDPQFGISIAKLVSLSEDAAFSKTHEMPRLPGSTLSKGWMQLDRGIIEIRFHSGANVEITGPAVFGIDTTMRGYLEFGHVRVHAPAEARDFVVGTTSMEVVDLGTRFELSVDRASNEAQVSVTEGLVDLHLGGEGAPQRIQSLSAGRRARVDPFGRILSIEGVAMSGRDTGLLAHWRLDRVGKGGIVDDSSGLNRHAHFRGDPDGSAVAGVDGDALNLAGGSYIDISEHVAALSGFQFVHVFRMAARPGRCHFLYFGWQPEESDSVRDSQRQFALWLARRREF